MRKTFAQELFIQMRFNKDIYLLTGDLGFGLFDEIRDTYKDRFINCGAAEQAMSDIAVGLALERKIPFVYSITPFLLYRPFETIRNYINYEKINVKLIGSGRDKDYEIDGFSHDASDVNPNMFSNIYFHFPNDKREIPKLIKQMIKSNQPEFLSLRR